MPPTNAHPPIRSLLPPPFSTTADSVQSFCHGSRLRPPDARLRIAVQIDEWPERHHQDTEFCELYEQEGGDVEQDVSVFHGWWNGFAHSCGSQSYRTRFVFLGLGGRVQCPLFVREAKMDLGGIDRRGVEWPIGADWMVTDFLVNMSASADILAQAKVEVDLSAIPLGKNVRSALLPFPTFRGPAA